MENGDIIEIFESESAPPENNEEDMTGTEASKNGTDGEKGKAKSKKTMIIGAAAAVIIIGAVGILTVIGNRGSNDLTENDPVVAEISEENAADVTTASNAAAAETAETSAEDIPVKPLYIPFDDTYKGDWKYDRTIDKNDLRHFKDSVRITLDVEIVKEDEWAAMRIEYDGGKILDVQAYNMGRDLLEQYVFYKGQTEFSFVVTSKVLENIDSRIQMCCMNLLVKSATVEDYDPKDDEVSPDAKMIQLGGEYTGWDGSPPIPKKELESFNGDVRVTLEIEAVKADPTGDDGEYRVHILPCGSEDEEVCIKADYITPCEYGDGLYALYNTAVPNKFTFVITADEISKLLDYGLLFCGSNFIAKSAALEKAYTDSNLKTF